MKVLIVSDVVNSKLYSEYVKVLAKDIELIISCGDLPAYYLNYLVTSLSRPLLYICGNHDHYDNWNINSLKILGIQKFYFDEIEYLNSTSNFGGKNIDNKIEKVNNLIFSGLEGSKVYNYGEHQYSENQMKEKIALLSPRLFFNRLSEGRFLDVLITHASPWKIHDKDDPAHQGFKSFLSFIKFFHPKYLLHGHVHIYDSRESRVADYYGTKVINCYDYQIIDL